VNNDFKTSLILQQLFNLTECQYKCSDHSWQSDKLCYIPHMKPQVLQIHF